MYNIVHFLNLEKKPLFFFGESGFMSEMLDIEIRDLDSRSGVLS